MPDPAKVVKTETETRQTTSTKDDFLGRFWASAQQILDDMLSLEVATYVTTGKETGEIILKVAPKEATLPDGQTGEYHAALQAYTKIKLDADTLAVLPVTEEYVVRKEIYEIHKEHVAMAQQTREAMVKAILDAAASLGGFLK